MSYSRVMVGYLICQVQRLTYPTILSVAGPSTKSLFSITSNLIDVALDADVHDNLESTVIDRDWFYTVEIPQNPNEPQQYSKIPITLRF